MHVYFESCRDMNWPILCPLWLMTLAAANFISVSSVIRLITWERCYIMDTGLAIDESIKNIFRKSNMHKRVIPAINFCCVFNLMIYLWPDS